MRPIAMVALLSVLVPCRGAAQSVDSGRWRWVSTADERSSRTDTRLILSSVQPGPILLFVCGNRLPADSARTLLFFTGESLFPYGGSGSAYMEVRFAGAKIWQPWYWLIYVADDPQTELPLTGMSRRAAFMGSQHNAYFSTEIFKRMLASDTVSIRYRAFGDSHEVRFSDRGIGPDAQGSVRLQMAHAIGAIAAVGLAGLCACPATQAPGPARWSAETIARVPDLPPDSIPSAVWDELHLPGNMERSAPEWGAPFPRNLVLVAFREDASRAEKQRAIDAIQGVVIGGAPVGKGGYYFVRIQDDGTSRPLFRAIEHLKSFPQVELASPELPEVGPQN